MKFWQHISYVCTGVDLDARCTGSGLFFPDCCKAFHKMQRIYQHFIEQYDCMHHCLLFPDKQMMMMMMMMKGSGWENKETTLPQSSLVHTARNMSSTTSLLLHSPHWDLTWDSLQRGSQKSCHGLYNLNASAADSLQNIVNQHRNASTCCISYFTSSLWPAGAGREGFWARFVIPSMGLGHSRPPTRIMFMKSHQIPSTLDQPFQPPGLRVIEWEARSNKFMWLFSKVLHQHF